MNKDSPNLDFLSNLQTNPAPNQQHMSSIAATDDSLYQTLLGINRATSAPPVMDNFTSRTLFSFTTEWGNSFSDIRCDENYEDFFKSYQGPAKLPPPLEPRPFGYGSEYDKSLIQQLQLQQAHHQQQQQYHAQQQRQLQQQLQQQQQLHHLHQQQLQQQHMQQLHQHQQQQQQRHHGYIQQPRPIAPSGNLQDNSNEIWGPLARKMQGLSLAANNQQPPQPQQQLGRSVLDIEKELSANWGIVNPIEERHASPSPYSGTNPILTQLMNSLQQQQPQQQPQQILHHPQMIQHAIEAPPQSIAEDFYAPGPPSPFRNKTPDHLAQQNGQLRKPVARSFAAVAGEQPPLMPQQPPMTVSAAPVQPKQQVKCVPPQKPAAPISKKVHGPGANDWTSKYQSIDEVMGKIDQLARDQYGCRFLQKKLEEEDPRDVEIIFNEIFDDIVELMTDPFGNYLCQKLVEHCNDQQRNAIIRKVSSELVHISLNMHGTRAVQKLIECLTTPTQIQMVVDALKSSVVTLIKDLNGNHVIQRCLHRLTPHDKQFIYDAVAGRCTEVATHRHGCCVLQRCIDFADENQKMQLVDEIIAHALPLVQDPFGNYVVQYILDLGIDNVSSDVIRNFLGHICDLSQNKFSSNVMEKCLRIAPAEIRACMIDELLNADNLPHMLQDSFANYVVQTAMSVSDAQQFNAFNEKIRPILHLIRNTPYGKKIENKLNKRPSQGGFARNNNSSSNMPMNNGHSSHSMHHQRSTSNNHGGRMENGSHRGHYPRR
eukprot:GEZU01000526.1.p1 GENE.GEZU01000526.1~~GEZU01000526.1.p1  ORF type:complete len:767 (-),score=228.44 GEZU01000526.1:927-3227(-)